MPKPARYEEIEIKLRVQDVDALRSRLKRLRAREITPRTHESNTLYDTPATGSQAPRPAHPHPNRNAGFELIRRGRPKENLEAILTYKGPSPLSSSAHASGPANQKSAVISRSEEEVEARYRSGRNARILRALGLRPVFRYEKFRTTYVLPGIRGLKDRARRDPCRHVSRTGRPAAAIDPRRQAPRIRPERLHDGHLRLVVSRRLPPPWPKARRHALSANKKIALTLHSFLDKDLNTVYLLSWSFLRGHERIRKARTLS